MGRLIDALLRRLVRGGFRRGVAGEHWAWLLVAGAAYVLQRARRPDARTERIRLRAGDRYLVSLQQSGGRRSAGGGGGRGDANGVVQGAEEAYRPRPTSG